MKYFTFKTVIFIVFFFQFFSMSCKKLIEIPSSPPNQLSSVQLFSDSASTLGAVAGIYTGFGIVNGSEPSFANGIITKLGGLSSDELINNLSFDSYSDQFFTNSILPANVYLNSMWTRAYINIYQINACLEGITSSKGLSNSFKNQVIGEIKVVRAFYYFNLINLFGGVPLVLSTDFKSIGNLPRASVNEVYAQIIADLSDARLKLKTNYPSSGHMRPNINTASALLAKVYLYQKQWKDAYDMSNLVITSGQYQLETDLNRVFLDESSEAIWQLPANGNFQQTIEASIFVPYSDTDLPNLSVTGKLLSAFEKGDQRKLNWLDSNKVDINGTSAVLYYPYKYKNLNNPAATTEDYMLLRLSDIFLVRAEASAHLNQISDAANDLNTIRKRAGLDKSPATNQTDLLAAIMHERQTELFCEWGNRWFDLKRTELANGVLGAGKSGWQPADVLYPIPQNELKLNSSLIQNPGY